jgi:hypothetical protein
VKGRLGAVLALAVAVAFAGCQHAEPGVRAAAAGDDPFGDGDTVAGAYRAVLSPDGDRLGVLSDDGLARVARNQLVPITEQGANVVDAAWFPNSATVLVAEGPAATGQVAVLDVAGDGHVRGSIRLDPPVGFGQGYGMSVAPGGRKAVATAVERPALEPEHRYLVAIDLETGATRALTDAGGPDESEPVHLTEERVAFVERTAGQVRTRTLDLATGAVEDVADGAAVVGAADGVPVVVDGAGRLRAGDRALGAVPAGTTVAGVDVRERTAVVVESTPSGARVRRVHL